MSNNPGGAADLGSAFSVIGFRNQRDGFTGYVRDANAILKIQQQVTQAHASQAASSQKTATSQQSGAAAAAYLAQQQARLADINRRVALSSTDAAGKVDLLTKEYRELDAAAKVAGLSTEELTKRQIAAAQAQLRLQQATNAQQRGLGPTLPRSVANVTAQGALGIAGSLGIATGVGELTQQIVQLGKESAALAVRAETIGTAFEASTERAGFATDTLLTKLKEASRGTVSETGLMLSANKALALGVGEDANQIGDLLAIARQKGKDFGIGTEQAFEDIVTGLGRASPLILDNLGIVLDLDKTYGDYARTLGKTATQLTEQEKKQALVNDVIRTNSDLIAKNATANEDAADRIAQAQARSEEAKTRLGVAILPVEISLLNSAATFLESVTGAFPLKAAEIEADLREQATSYEDYVRRINEARAKLNPENKQGHETTADQQVANNLAAQQVTEEQFELAKAIERTYTSYKAYVVAAQDAAAGGHAVAKSAETLTGSADRATTAIQLLAGAASALGDDLPDRASRLAAISDEIIRAGEQIEAAETQRNQRLDDLEERHADKVADLQQDIVDTNLRAQVDIVKAVADGVARRAELEQQLAEKVSDFIADHAQQVARQLEDQRISDERSARNFADSQQDALDDYNEQRTEAEASYQERRLSIIDGYNQNEERLEADHQRELIRTERESQLSRYRSQQSFLTSLYDLTRGRRNKGALEEAKAAFAAAREEAAQLASIDPEAAATLLAERQRQILAGIERKREEAQLRRDARRGGGITPVDVEAEIADINTITDEADRAAIDAIKAGAQERADDRERQKEERATARDESLADLDTQYADEKERAAAAFEDQRREAQEARAQQLADQEADRRLAQQRRDADYAAQLHELELSNAAQLSEFDKSQVKRIDQIRLHADQQVTATKTQLKRVDDEYDDARQAVLDDYDTFIADLNDKLKTSADQLDMLPSDLRVEELKEGYGKIADALGDEVARRLAIKMGAIDLLAPGATGAAPRNAGVSSAARAVTAGGRIISDFGDDRTGVGGTGARSHQGIDISGQYGAPIHALTGGIVEFAGWNDLGGWYVQILDDTTGTSYYYAHMAEQSPLRKGDRVRAGQVIGRVGTSGDAAGTEPHVHIQVGRNGNWVDPATVLAGYTEPQQQTGSAARGGQHTQSRGGRQAYSMQSQASQRTSTPLPMDRTPLPLPTVPIAINAASTTRPNVVVDLHNSTFGTGLTETTVRGWIEPLVDDALLRYDQALQRDVEDARTRGAYTV